MKLIIQIPCYNEEATLKNTLGSLPVSMPGICTIEYLVIDDGSKDDTARIARELGVHHIVSLPRHLGLAQAFVAGLEASLRHSADIIVNTDADNQYQAEDLPKLIEPILTGNADLVIGDRGVSTQRSFSVQKRLLQRLGSRVVQIASGITIPDATSGFRALSREAALRTIVRSQYSYTLETLIQAGASQMAVTNVPVRTNPKSRRSRLMRSIPHYMGNAIMTILRSYTMYRPMRVFFFFGGMMILTGLTIGARFLHFYLMGSGGGHIQSLILSAILLIVGFQVCLMGLVSDLIGFNRKILEEALYRIRRFELNSEKHD